MGSDSMWRAFRFAPLIGFVLLCGAGRGTAAQPAHAAGESARSPRVTEHEGHGTAQAAPESRDVASTSSSVSAFSELKATRDSIAQLVEHETLHAVHEKSERLEQLGGAVLEAAKTLPVEKRTRVEAALRQLPPISKALHTAADAGNASAARRELARLDGLLALIEAQDPAGALGKAEPGAGGHARQDAPSGAHVGHEHAGADPGAHAHRARPLAAVDETPKATLRVKSGEFSFDPKSLVMRAGEPTRIELQNGGAVEHALIVAAPDGAGDWIHLHAMANATDAGTFRIDRAGTYPVRCTVPGHTEAGMVGELVVR